MTDSAMFETDRFLQEFCEEEFLYHVEYISAFHAGQPVALQGFKRESLTTWASLRELLLALAFGIDSTDPWEVLGVPRMEGPMPSV